MGQIIKMWNHSKFDPRWRNPVDPRMRDASRLHLKNPLIVAWWSAAFPGFGHILLSKWVTGLLLMGWEVIINWKARLNSGILYTFTGRFELAGQTIDFRWLALYAPVFLFSVCDSYRTAVELNHECVLAAGDGLGAASARLHFFEIHDPRLRNPWAALGWSLLLPGLGQLYNRRIFAAFLLSSIWIGMIYASHGLEMLHYTLTGDPVRAREIVEWQWLLFLPSVFYFSAYDAYVNAVENNRLYRLAKKRWLQERYQQTDGFAMPPKAR